MYLSIRDRSSVIHTLFLGEETNVLIVEEYRSKEIVHLDNYKNSSNVSVCASEKYKFEQAL